MNNEYLLNRLKITGKLNEKTPHYVITEIIRAHNICIVKPISSVEELIKDIKMVESYRCMTIKEPFSNKDLRLLATYVNIDYNTWTKTSLLSAYKHMHDVNQDVDLSKIYYGQKSYENIDAYNSCMLYGLCVKNGIQTEWNMKPETMCFLLKQTLLSISSLKEQLLTCVENLNKSSLVNLINKAVNSNKLILSEVNEPIITKETPKNKLPPVISLEVSDLTDSLNRYKNSAYILQQINPKTHYDAVILAALNYNLNLTESKHPFEEYMRIKEVKNISLYKPVDLEFRKRYLTNPDWYNLSTHWEPKLSFIYDENGLKKLCVYEGFDHEDFRSYGFDSLLQISRISFNAFLGKNVYSTEEYTPIELNEIKDLHNNECITLGNVETKDMTTYTFNELADHFAHAKNFTNPAKLTESLDKRIIRKIGLYASKLNYVKMLEAIEVVEKWKSYSSEHTDKLRSIYHHNYNITDILYKILECGMYMRGWRVSSEKYPIGESLTISDKIENAALRIDTNVVNSINDVFDRLKLYRDEEIKILENLPLIKTSIDGDNINYIVSPDPDDGSSIFERLRIVLGGEKYKNMKSCIRLTSNILLISVHYYLCSLGIHEPFNIRELDHIT